MFEVDRHWMRLPLEEIALTSQMGTRWFVWFRVKRCCLETAKDKRPLGCGSM